MKTLPFRATPCLLIGFICGSLAAAPVAKGGSDSPEPSNSPSTADFALDSNSSGESKVSALSSEKRGHIKMDFIPEDERARRTSKGFPCVSPPEGAYGVEGHGTPYNIFDRTGEPMSAGKLAERIRSDRSFQAGMTVYLLCCETGKGNRSFAQKLADSLGSEVVAPTEKLWPLKTGRYVVAQERMRKTFGIFEKGEQRADHDKPGTMKTFRPTSTAPAVASSRDEVSQPSSSSSAASPVRAQNPQKRPLLRASARTAALLAGMPRQKESTMYWNSKER